MAKPKTIQDLVPELKGQDTSGDLSNDWKNARVRTLEYFHGRTREEIKPFYKNFKKMKIPTDNNNVTKRIVERVSLVYMQSPERIIGDIKKKDEDSQRELYKKFTPDKNERMHKAEKYLNLLNLIVLHPAWRNGVLEYDIITDFIPTFEEDDLMNPSGIAYPLHSNTMQNKEAVVKWAFWDKNRHITFNGKTHDIIRAGSNFYNILPFVSIFTDKPETEFLDVDPASDLVDMNLSINVLGTDHTVNMRYGSFGHLYATGFREDTEVELEVGPHKVLLLPEGSDVGVLNPPDMIVTMGQGIKDKIRAVTNNWHLPQGFIEGDQAQPESGTALAIRNQELTDERVGDVKRWRRVEAELYPIERAIIRVDGGKTVPKEFMIDYKEKVVILSAEEQREKDQWDLEHNQITEAKVLIRDNPDRYKNLAAAEAEVKKNRDQNTALGEDEKSSTRRILDKLKPTETVSD